MVSNTHYIELYINGGLMELESQESLHLRINNVLFNPTKTSTKQAEYSYSFDIPSTPNNDKILDYANNLSKINKFHTRYSAQVYSDGNLIFDGSLTIQKYDAKDKMYNCNLVNIKINTLEDIFGDDVLTDVKWEVEFNGARTIDEVNADANSKYWFPLICYGAFSKNPVSSDNPYNRYTSKYLIDWQNDFTTKSLYPSLNMLEEVRKCFEYKGYNVGGDVFSDPILSNIYCSTNLADGQDPTYNVGNEMYGKLDLDVSWIGAAEIDFADVDNPTHTYTQNLRFPCFPAENPMYDLIEGKMEQVEHWNFKDIFYNSMLYYPWSIRPNISVDSTYNMYQPRRDREGGTIVIPADGFYKVSLSGTAQITMRDGEKVRANQYVHEWDSHTTAMTESATSKTIEFSPDLAITTPIEVQLIRNYDDNIELIRGKNNIQIMDGYPENATEMGQGRTSNWFNYTCCYPHEKLGAYYTYIITNTDEISDTSYNRSDASIGYVYGNGDIHCYDPVVSPAFICGFTTMGNKNGGGCVSFTKNGYSWSKTYSERTDAMYKQQGYKKLYVDSAWTIHEDQSTVNQNTLDNSPQPYFSQSLKSCTASVSGIVYLKKGDKIDLVAVRRGYWESDVRRSYSCRVDANIKIEAASPKNIFMLRAENYGWNSSTEFPTMLNLMEFTNKEKKISDWLKNIQDAFNITYEFNGNSVDVNQNKGLKKNLTYAVNIDDRVNSNEVESEYISYPKEMSIKYKIDTDEHGFYESVPPEHINDSDWKNWGDSGFTVIQLNDDSYETSSQNKQTQFSYCWYDNSFKFEDDEEVQHNLSPMPVISKEEYMIDGYNYEEAMKHRGYTLPQRFWFRQFNSEGYRIRLTDDWAFSATSFSSSWRIRQVDIYLPTNQQDGINLSYKDTETSLVTEYFNIYPMLSSNYVNVETFLNPIEYIQIKGGALVNFDSDLYYTSEISGYDPSGANPTKLKLIKKT